jgi:hypothetical protein
MWTSSCIWWRSRHRPLLLSVVSGWKTLYATGYYHCNIPARNAGWQRRKIACRPDGRTDLERFNEEIEREQYEHLSGQKDDIDTESIYARYSRIFEDEDLIMDVRDRRETTRNDECLRMGYLYGFLLGGYAGRKITRLDDQLHALQAKAEVEVDGKNISFHSVPAVLANEPDHGKREAIDLAREPVFGRLNPLFRERLEVV